MFQNEAENLAEIIKDEIEAFQTDEKGFSWVLTALYYVRIFTNCIFQIHWKKVK